MIIKDYLHLIDMAKDKTVLQTLGFAYGEREISARIYNTSFGGGGCGVCGWGHRLFRRTDQLKSSLSSHEASVGQLILVQNYMTGQDRWF